MARQPHPLAAKERAVGADEDLLRDVLGIGRLAEPAAAIAQDLAAVAAVERSARLVGARGRPVDGGDWAGRHAQTTCEGRAGVRARPLDELA